MVATMFCHLCRVDASTTHDGSPRHRAARQIAAVALERLSNHAAACDNSDSDSEDVIEPTAETGKALVSFCDSCNITILDSEFYNHLQQRNHTLALLNDQTLEELVRIYVDEEGKLLEGPSCSQNEFDCTLIEQAKAVKTYTCHFCALDVPLAFKTKHERGPRHVASRALAISVARRLRDTLATSGDKSEDKAPDRSGDKSKNTSDKSKDRSEDASKDTAEDESYGKSEDTEEKPRFSTKMMKKLLRTYTGRNIDEDKHEHTEEPELIKTDQRLTAKQYFKDILPHLSYIGSFHTLVIDDTEFVTIQIGRDTLKIHVNNFNGLYNYGGTDGCYMNCRVCDGSHNTCYGSNGDHDRLHVMSLGHIRNVMTPFDSVHLIRKIDETHSTCALCNVYIPSHLIDHHILKDVHHTTALTEALERGKHFEDNNQHLKIIVYSPAIYKPSLIMKPSQGHYGFQKWPFNQAESNTGTLFGNAQNNSAFGSGWAQSNPGCMQSKSAFGSAHNFAGTQGSIKALNAGWAQSNPDWPQSHATFSNAQNNSAFGSVQNFPGVQGQTNALNAGWAQSNPGWPQSHAAFGNAQNNSAFGSVQNFPGVQGQTNALNAGWAQSNPGWPQSHAAFGNAQNNSAFGSAQNFPGAQGQTNALNAGWAQRGPGWAQSNSAFGSAQNTSAFGSAQNFAGAQGQTNNALNISWAQNKPAFGGVKNSVFGAQNKTNAFGSTQNNAVSIGNAQNTAVGDQNKTADFGAQNSAVSFGNARNNAGFGTAQNNAVPFGRAQNNASFGTQNGRGLFGTAQNNKESGESAQNPAGFGAQNKTNAFGTTQSNSAPFSTTQNTTGFDTAQNNTTAGRSAQNRPGCGPHNKTTVFGTTQNNAALFVSALNTAGFGAQNDTASLGTKNQTAVVGNAQNLTSFGHDHGLNQTSSAVNNASLCSAQGKPSSFGNIQNNTTAVDDKNTIGLGCGDKTGQPGLLNNAQNNADVKIRIQVTSNETSTKSPFSVTKCKTQANIPNASSQVSEESLQTESQPSNDNPLTPKTEDFKDIQSSDNQNNFVAQTRAQNNNSISVQNDSNLDNGNTHSRDSDRIYSLIKKSNTSHIRFRAFSSSSSESM